MKQRDLDEGLMWACERGNVEITKLLLENGADVYHNRNIALYSASYHGYLEIARTCLSYMKDGIQDHDVINVAHRQGHGDVVELLLEHGAVINYLYWGRTL